MPTPLGRVANSRLATPLPDPLPGLAASKYRVMFGRGQLCMLCGAPGAGKTTLALIMAIRCGVPTLYFSADSDEITMAARAASAVTKHPYSTVRAAQNVGAFDDDYGDAIAELPLRWVFDSEPSLDDISLAIEAYVELWGVCPQLIVIDNLMNLRSDDQNEWQGMRQTVKSLHWMARKTKACIWLLHHTSEQSDGYITGAPPRSAIQGKLAQLPEVILTLANGDDGFYVAVVKNRHGAADPLAKQPLKMVMDFSRNQLYDQPMALTIGGPNGNYGRGFSA